MPFSQEPEPPAFYGLTEDDVIVKIENGETLTRIAADVGKDKSMLSRWLAADEQRSARAREARIVAASSWDESAEDEIRNATDSFQLSRAKELAHHYRWRASKIAPKLYGDKLLQEHSGPNGQPIETHSTVTLAPDEAYKRMLG